MKCQICRQPESKTRGAIVNCGSTYPWPTHCEQCAKSCGECRVQREHQTTAGAA